MIHLAALSFPAAATWCFGLTVVSAIVPWVNAELIVLSLPAIAGTRLALAGLVAVATVGQMAGKCVVYWAARRGSHGLATPSRPRVERWRQRLQRRAWATPALVLISSTVGVPPFYAVTLLAGALRVNFGVYLLAGTMGRLLRFGGLVAGASALLARS